MERRECSSVISDMIKIIPPDQIQLLEDLNVNLEDSSYKAPEENIQWYRTSETLQKHIPSPKEDWEFEVLSVFSKLSIDEIKEIVKNTKE